jgi:hypothetical protein
MLLISVRLEKHNQEEQPLIIVHKTNLIRDWVDPYYGLEVRDYTNEFWEHHGRAQLNHLHDDHGSRDLHNDTRCRTLRLAQHIWQHGEDVRFSSTILYVRILVTTSLHLKRTHHSGENEGKEDLVSLIASHQQSLWRVIVKIANKAKISTTCRQIQVEVRASTSKSHSRVILQLQVGRGSSDASQRDLEAANTELSDTDNEHTQVDQLKFLALHNQRATIYLTRKGTTPPTVDPSWDLGWMVPHPEREIPTISGKTYNKDMQKMDELWKSTHNRSRKCHHCSRTAGSNTNMRSP